MKYTFRKQEKLCSRTAIQELFTKGSSFYLDPFLVKFTTSDGLNHQTLVSVSKRKFKSAVDRNLVKRRIRESFRLNKTHLLPLTEQKKILNIAFIYTKNHHISFEMIEKKMILVLDRLVKEASKKTT